MEPQRQDIQKLTSALRDHTRALQALTFAIKDATDQIGALAARFTPDEED